MTICAGELYFIFGAENNHRNFYGEQSHHSTYITDMMWFIHKSLNLAPCALFTTLSSITSCWMLLLLEFFFFSPHLCTSFVKRKLFNSNTIETFHIKKCCR